MFIAARVFVRLPTWYCTRLAQLAVINKRGRIVDQWDKVNELNDIMNSAVISAGLLVETMMIKTIGHRLLRYVCICWLHAVSVSLLFKLISSYFNYLSSLSETMIVFVVSARTRKNVQTDNNAIMTGWRPSSSAGWVNNSAKCLACHTWLSLFSSRVPILYTYALVSLPKTSQP